MSATNKTTHYELSQYIGTDKPTYLSDYNGDMLKIDNAIHDAASDASAAVSTANSAVSAAADASTAASTATTTANSALSTANSAASTASTASTNAGAALTAAAAAQTAAAANTITNLASAYDPTLTYAVGDLVTYIDDQGSGKLYKCIIAVSSPEAFNINKWDDVTTSEVYARSRVVLSTVTSDGVKTRGEMIEELLANFVPSNGNTYRIRVLANSGEANEQVIDMHFTQYNKSSNIKEFCSVGGGASGSNGIVVTNDIIISGGTGSYYQNVLSGTTWTVQNLTSSVPSNGSSVITLYAE